MDVNLNGNTITNGYFDGILVQPVKNPDINGASGDPGATDGTATPGTADNIFRVQGGDAVTGGNGGDAGYVAINGGDGASGYNGGESGYIDLSGGDADPGEDGLPGGSVDLHAGGAGLVTSGYDPQDNAHDGSSSDWILAYNGTTANGGGNAMVPVDLSTLYAGGSPLSAFLSPANVDSSIISAAEVGNVVNGPNGLVQLDPWAGDLYLNSNLYVTGSSTLDNYNIYTDGAGSLTALSFAGDGSALGGYAPSLSVGNADHATTADSFTGALSAAVINCQHYKGYDGTDDGMGGAPGTAGSIYINGGDALNGINGGNGGTINLSGGTGQYGSTPGYHGGSIDLSGGAVTGGSAYGGTISMRGSNSNADGGSGGSISMNGSDSVDDGNGGSIAMNGGNSANYSDHVKAGSIAMNGGTGTQAAGGSISINGGSSSYSGTANGGSISMNGGTTSGSITHGGTISMNGGTDGGQDSNGGSIIMDGGTSTNSSTASGGTLNLSGGNTGPGATIDMQNGSAGIKTTGYSPQDHSHDSSSDDYVLAYSGTIANGGTNLMTPTSLGSLYVGGVQLSSFAKIVSAPSTSGDSGTAGQVAYDSSYFYVCVATNTWKRVALSTF